MTVSVHKMVDALKHKTYYDYGGLLTLDGLKIELLIDAAEQAECFDFGNLTLEILGEGTSKLPELTDDEIEFWVDGLIPLPAPFTWFEFILPTTTSRSAFLVLPDLAMFRVDFVDGVCHIDGVTTVCEDDKLTKFRIDGDETKVFLNSEALTKGHASAYRLMVYLALMLNSKSTETMMEIAPPKLNKNRTKLNRSPLKDHTVVTIVPASFIKQSYADSTQLRKAPRLHWRRSHLRTINKGGETERRVVVVRMLVGKKELGEVSHEYRVRTSVKPHQSIVGETQ